MSMADDPRPLPDELADLALAVAAAGDMPHTHLLGVLVELDASAESALPLLAEAAAGRAFVALARSLAVIEPEGGVWQAQPATPSDITGVLGSVPLEKTMPVCLGRHAGLALLAALDRLQAMGEADDTTPVDDDVIFPCRDRLAILTSGQRLQPGLLAGTRQRIRTRPGIFALVLFRVRELSGVLELVHGGPDAEPEDATVELASELGMALTQVAPEAPLPLTVAAAIVGVDLRDARMAGIFTSAVEQLAAETAYRYNRSAGTVTLPEELSREAGMILTRLGFQDGPVAAEPLRVLQERIEVALLRAMARADAASDGALAALLVPHLRWRAELATARPLPTSIEMLVVIAPALARDEPWALVRYVEQLLATLDTTVLDSHDRRAQVFVPALTSLARMLARSASSMADPDAATALDAVAQGARERARAIQRWRIPEP
jgi:hypothetical protein